MMRVFLEYIFKFVAVFITPAFVNSIKIKKNVLRSLWIKNFFAKCGKNLYVNSDVVLINHKQLFIGNNVTIDQGCMITPINSGIIDIEDNVKIGNHCHITSFDSIKIGNNVLIAQNVTITDNSHGSIDKETLDISPTDRKIVSKGEVVIESNVWIAEKAIILPNVTIGKGSVIGAGAVVTKNVPPYSVAVGNPARVIKTL